LDKIRIGTMKVVLGIKDQEIYTTTINAYNNQKKICQSLENYRIEDESNLKKIIDKNKKQ